MSDPALLHSTLWASAFSLCMLRGKGPSIDVFYHRGESIRLMNKALHEPKRMITDANICTVACLTLFEASHLNIIYHI
jgi:hypothetical protein